MKLKNVRLLVDDPAATFRFYRDVVGLTPQWGNEGDSYAYFTDADGGIVELLERKAMVASEQADKTVLVYEVDDVDAALAKLKELGAQVAAGATDQEGFGIRTAHVRDTEGNLIEIYKKLG